jgi:hypothetical protein
MRKRSSAAQMVPNPSLKRATTAGVIKKAQTNSSTKRIERSAQNCPLQRPRPRKTERYKYQQVVMWCGFDENLEQGARCKRLLNNPLNSRVFVEDFAAKLPTAPQFTV